MDIAAIKKETCRHIGFTNTGQRVDIAVLKIEALLADLFTKKFHSAMTLVV